MLPNWLDTPTPPSDLPHLPLLRVPPGPGIIGLITAPSLLGTQTHFMNRRTLPCLAPDCPGCEAKLARREEWYSSLWTQSPSKHVIAALTPAVAWQITEATAKLPTIRGLRVHLYRSSKRPNSRLLASIAEVEFHETKLPDPPDLQRHLLHIWGLDQSHLAQDDQAYVNRVKDHFRGNGTHADAK